MWKSINEGRQRRKQYKWFVFLQTSTIIFTKKTLLRTVIQQRYLWQVWNIFYDSPLMKFSWNHGYFWHEYLCKKRTRRLQLSVKLRVKKRPHKTKKHHEKASFSFFLCYSAFLVPSLALSSISPKMGNSSMRLTI